MSQWGWRIPFAIGAVAALYGFKLRQTLPETSTEQSRQKAAASSFAALWLYRRSLFVVLGLTAGGSLTFYTFTTYMQKRLVNTAGLSVGTASAVMAAALTLYMMVQPVFGALSDRIGARASVRWFGILMVVSVVPLLHALAIASGFWVAFLLVSLALVLMSFYSACGAVLKADLFPIELRAFGVGLAYAVANALFGGTAEYVALQLKAWGREDYFSWYVVGLCAVALVAAVAMPDTDRVGHLAKDTGHS